MFVYCECCVFSGRGLCDELITRPEESYRMWCVIECELETSWMRRPWPSGGCRAKKTPSHVLNLKSFHNTGFSTINPYTVDIINTLSWPTLVWLQLLYT
jgi:hypothetical protein